MAIEAKTLPPTTEIALKVLKKALESTAKESVEYIGGYLLVQAVSAAVAGPGAAILGAAAEALISALLEQTSAVEQKLDALIAEPLDTATAIIRDALELHAATDDEKNEAREDLRDALREIRAAYSYATRLHPEQCLLIRFYQCIVLALMRGRHYQLTKYITQLAEAATECDNKASENERLASKVSLPFSDEEFEAVVNRPGF